MRPPSMIAMWLPILSASSRSWLTKMMVFFKRCCRARSSSCRWLRISGSSAENGSSMSRMSASVANARARPTRCCMPPESSWGYLSRHSARPTSSSFSATIRSRSALPMPRSSRPKPTFSWTVRQGRSANCWNTMAMRFMRRRLSVAASQATTSMAPAPSRTSTWPRVALLRPLTQRSSVDLPEPESPMSTQISPSSMASEAPATPSTWPVSARIS